MMRFLYLLIIMIILPYAGWGCPMCQGGTSGETTIAYRGTTVFLVLLPFITGYFIYRYVKKNF